MRTSYLFGEQASIHDVVEPQKQQTARALENLPAEAILARPSEELIAELVERFRLDVPVLQRAATMQLPNEEIDIDVSGDPMRGIFDRSKPFYVKGTAIRISVPFTGEDALFKFGTAPYPYGQPIPGELDGNSVVLTYVAEHPDPAAVRKDFDNRLDGIEQVLQMARGTAEEWNRRLAELVRQRLEQRRSKLERDRGLTLGYPAAPETQRATAKATPRLRHKDRDPEYDLFLSHASEDKESIARPLYAVLVAASVSVWFDEAVLKLGDSLRQKIDQGLARCRYGVVILSPNFLSKRWPQRELDGLVARETSSGEKAILPIWHQLDRDTLLRYLPTLADRVAGHSDEGVEALVRKILEVLKS